jgi:hypothetical protein
VRAIPGWRLLGVVGLVVLPCDWAWLVAGTFVALFVLWSFRCMVDCWQRDVRVAMWVRSSWERSSWEDSGWEESGWENSGGEVRRATADVCSEGNGDVSGWWRWRMHVGHAGGGEEGHAQEGD